MRNILSVFMLSFMSCIALNPPQKIKQGLYGTVLLKQGNQMPGPGRAISNGQSVKREIVIYQLTNINDVKNNNGFFYEVKTALVAKTTSNTKGNFAVALPAGQYSVFVIEKEGLYANYFNGKGSINPVEILPDSLTQKDIYISNKAAF